MGHDALRLQQIARVLLHELSHRHEKHGTASGKPVGGAVDNLLTEVHLSETNGSDKAWTWKAHFTDGDTNYLGAAIWYLWGGTEELAEKKFASEILPKRKFVSDQ